MKRYGVIYKITNKINGMSYIGQTVNTISKRFSAHKRDKRKNRYLTSVINKYGEENFLFEELITCFDINGLNYYEQYAIDIFNTMVPNGYNVRPGGNQYGKLSEDTKKKISSTKTGKPLLVRRGEERSDKQRTDISRTLGGQTIVAICEKTGRTTFFHTAHETTNYGFQPWNVISVCKNKRPRHKDHKFLYYKDYANQSGSTESKEFVHAQRLDLETTKVD